MAEEIIIVQGNNTLAGDVAVSGAKNSALKLIAAALLGQGKRPSITSRSSRISASCPTCCAVWARGWSATAIR